MQPLLTKQPHMMNLKDSLTQHNSIVLNARANNWQQAIKLGTDKLEHAGVVDKRYYQSILNVTEDMGAYYILAPGLAMPHASPTDGPLTNGFALVTLEKPVIFDEDNEPVDILVTVAATDRTTHNKSGIMQVAKLFQSQENFERVRNAQTPEDIIALIEENET